MLFPFPSSASAVDRKNFAKKPVIDMIYTPKKVKTVIRNFEAFSVSRDRTVREPNNRVSLSVFQLPRPTTAITGLARVSW